MIEPPGKSHNTCAYKLVDLDGKVPAVMGDVGKYSYDCFNPKILKSGKYTVKKVTVLPRDIREKQLTMDVAVLNVYENKSPVIPTCIEINELKSTKVCLSCREYKHEVEPEIKVGHVALTDGGTFDARSTI